MDHIKIIAEFFLVSLALSLTLFSPIAKSQLTGNGFIKLISNVALGSLLIALIINIVSGNGFFVFSNALKEISILSIVLITIYHEEKKSNLMWILYFIIISCLLVHISLFSSFHYAQFIFLIGSAFLLGIITYSMLLGHWYLVVPKLSEKPLLIAAKLTWLILILKIIFSSFGIKNNLDFFSEMTTLGSGYAFNWMLLLMRSLFGYVVIAGMSYFNWKLIKMRSIQSSTGVLYAMTFFVFVGELISSYMFFNYGILI